MALPSGESWFVGPGRRFVVTWAGAVASGAVLGGTLALAGLVQRHFPLLAPGERVALVLRWAAVGAVAGGVAGIGTGVLAASVRRRWWRRVLLGAFALGAVALTLRLGQHVPSPWASLGDAVDYPAPQGRHAAAAAPNLVLVTIDTLRRDHLELYGYERATAPNLAAFAREGGVFETAIAQAPETLRSVASLVTGLYPHVLEREYQARGSRGPFVGAALHTVAERLSAAGYDTAGFVANAYLKRQNGFGQGFHHFDDESALYRWRGREGKKSAADLVELAVTWIDRAVPPFFLWVHVMDPHHPYEPQVRGAWEDTAPPHVRTHEPVYGVLSVSGYTQRLKELGRGRRSFAPGELEHLLGRYDSEILQTDRAIGALLTALRGRGFDDRNTVVVVTSDHGEEFADHGGTLHGHTLFDELIRVPLLVRGAGIPPGRRVMTQVELIDVAPTLLALAGLGDASALWGLHGRTLLPALEGRARPPTPALSMRGTAYVAYRTPEWKLVVAFEPYESPAAPWGPWQGLEAMARIGLGREPRRRIGLWRLDRDSREQRDVLSEELKAAQALYAAARRHLEAHPPLAVVSPPEPGLEPRTVEALRALGYAE